MNNQERRQLFEHFTELETAWNDFSSLIRRTVSDSEWQVIKHTWLLNVEANLGIGDALPFSRNATRFLESEGIDLDEARDDEEYFDRLEEEELSDEG